MTLRTKRLGASFEEPLCLEVQGTVAPASALLWHLQSLPGLRVVAKKSWALTDDFEGYFLYKGRLYLIQTPFVDVWVSQMGQPAEEAAFREVELKVQSFSFWRYIFSPLAILRYAVLPFNPSSTLLQAHGVKPPERPASRGKNAA